jgi:hypothetical protein
VLGVLRSTQFYSGYSRELSSTPGTHEYSVLLGVLRGAQSCSGVHDTKRVRSGRLALMSTQFYSGYSGVHSRARGYTIPSGYEAGGSATACRPWDDMHGSSRYSRVLSGARGYARALGVLTGTHRTGTLRCYVGGQVLGAAHSDDPGVPVR